MTNVRFSFHMGFEEQKLVRIQLSLRNGMLLENPGFSFSREPAWFTSKSNKMLLSFGLGHLSQLLKAAWHLCRWRQKEVAKIVQCGLSRFTRWTLRRVDGDGSHSE